MSAQNFDPDPKGIATISSSSAMVSDYKSARRAVRDSGGNKEISQRAIRRGRSSGPKSTRAPCAHWACGLRSYVKEECDHFDHGALDFVGRNIQGY